MENTQAPPRIFDPAILLMRRERASKRPTSFLLQRCAEDVAERICDINRTFTNALVFGSIDFLDDLLNSLPASRHPQRITRAEYLETPDKLSLVNVNEGGKIKAQDYDLVISALNLQSTNDLPGILYAFRQHLYPDGLFLGAMFGGETLTELRQAFYKADEEIFGGMSAHIYPFADYSQSAALLQRAGYALPVIDSDRFTVNYGKLQTLLDDLRDLGETNVLTSRQDKYIGKAYRMALEQAYRDLHPDLDKLKATFEILWMTGWAPHESQQKPLKPGSAQMRLADALRTEEKKL